MSAPVDAVVMAFGVPGDVVDLFRKFCDPSSVRYNLSEPFVQDGRLYATDGNIVISITTDAPNTVVDGRLPNAATVVDFDTVTTEEWDPAIVECVTCNGDGTIERVECGGCSGTGDCQSCGGSGVETCIHCEHDHDCDECDGGGMCPDCNGDGKTEAYRSQCEACKDTTVEIGGVAMKIATARRISLLKNVRYSVIDKYRNFKVLVFDAYGGIRGCAVCQSP